LALADGDGRVNRLIHADLVIDGAAFHELQQILGPEVDVRAIDAPRDFRAAAVVVHDFADRPGPRHVRRCKAFVDVDIVVLGDADLLEIVATLRAARGFAGGLHGRQQERDQNRDDRNHNQQFDQSETSTHSRHEMKLPRKKNEKSAQSRALIPFCAQEPANSRRTTRPGLALNVASKAGTAALPFSRAGFVAVSGAYVTKVVCRSMGPIDKVSLKKCEVFRTIFGGRVLILEQFN